MAFPGTTVPYHNDTEQELLAKIILQLQAGIPSGAPAVSYNAGAADATTQRTVTASDSPDVVSNAAIKTAVEAVAQAGAGAVSATTQRVVLATDDPAVASLASILAALSPSATQGGLDTILIGSLTNAAQAVKASSGRLHGVHCVNNHTAIVYVQIFDLATGSVTLGTTVPKQSYAVPANGGILDLPLPDPISFATAITVACTTTYNGSTAPGTTLIFNARYK